MVVGSEGGVVGRWVVLDCWVVTVPEEPVVGPVLDGEVVAVVLEVATVVEPVPTPVVRTLVAPAAVVEVELAAVEVG